MRRTLLAFACLSCLIASPAAATEVRRHVTPGSIKLGPVERVSPLDQLLEGFGSLLNPQPRRQQRYYLPPAPPPAAYAPADYFPPAPPPQQAGNPCGEGMALYMLDGGQRCLPLADIAWLEECRRRGLAAAQLQATPENIVPPPSPAAAVAPPGNRITVDADGNVIPAP